MSSRYFVIESPELLAVAAQDSEALKESLAKRTAFLMDWGSKQILARDNRIIVGLMDPKKMDPPRERPKGWRAIRGRHGGFVEPTIPETRVQLRNISDPCPIATIEAVFGVVRAAIPLSEREEGWRTPFKADSKPLWFGVDKMYFPAVYLFEHHAPVVSIPNDPTLTFTVLPGLREIFQWELEQAIVSENAKNKELTS